MVVSRSLYLCNINLSRFPYSNMKSISKRSWIYRFAYHNSHEKPSRVSVCELMNAFIKQIFKSLIYIIFLCIASVVTLVVITPIQFLCGKRPAFINLLKGWNDTPAPRWYKDMPLPTIGSFRIRPILPLLMICLAWLVFNFRLDAIFTDFGVVWFVRIMSCMGAVGGLALIFTALHQFESWRVFLFYLKSRWNDKVCFTLEVTD